MFWTVTVLFLVFEVRFLFWGTLLALVRGMFEYGTQLVLTFKQKVAQYQESEGFFLCTGANVEMFMESYTSFSKSACLDVQMLTQYKKYVGFVLCTGTNLEMFMESCSKPSERYYRTLYDKC
jgi:hypothetical protein